MDGKPALGIFGLDDAGSLLARRAIDSGSTLVIHGPSAARPIPAPLGAVPSGDGQTIRVVPDVDSFAAALSSPRVVLVGLRAAGTGNERDRLSQRCDLVDSLKRGDLVIVCSDGSWAGYAAVSDRCAAGGVACVDVGVSVYRALRGDAVVVAGGTAENWDTASGTLGAWSVAARVGGPGSGCAVSVIRAAMEGLGIELLAEMYHIMRVAFRTSNDEMRTVFAQWNAGELADPLLAATADALGLMDEDGLPLIEKVLDAGAAAGPCSEAAAIALEAGVPAPMISLAACAQAAAARKDERVAASAVLGDLKAASTGDRSTMVEELRKAFNAATIVATAEGFLLLGAASKRRDLDLDPILAARLPDGKGRSGLQERLADALVRGGARKSVLLDAGIKTAMDQSLPSLRHIVARAMEGGIPVPALSAALSSYDSFRSTWLPANVANALRDSLHGEGFERVDRPRGEMFHSDWT